MVVPPASGRGSFASYASISRRHLGSIPLQRLDRARCRSLYQDLRAVGLSPKSVLTVHLCLHCALAQVVEDDIIRPTQPPPAYEKPKDQVEEPRPTWTLTFSTTAFLAIQTTTNSVDVFLGRLLVQYGMDMFVSTDRPQPYERIRADLLATPSVATVERFENTGAKSHWDTVILTGTENDPKLYRREVLNGRWFRPGDTGVVLANEQLASQAGLNVGDSLPLSLDEKTESFRVIGIVSDLNGNWAPPGWR